MIELFFAVLGTGLGLCIGFGVTNAAWLLGAVLVCGVAVSVLRRWMIKKDGEIRGE